MTTCPISTVPAGDTRDASFSDVSGSVSLIAEKVIQQHPQPGQPAQATPCGEHHPGLAGFPLADGTFVHIQPVGQLDVSQGISPRTKVVSRAVGSCQSSPLTSVYPLNSPDSIISRIRCWFSGFIMNPAAEEPSHGVCRRIVILVIFFLQIEVFSTSLS